MHPTTKSQAKKIEQNLNKTQRNPKEFLAVPVAAAATALEPLMNLLRLGSRCKEPVAEPMGGLGS